MKNSEQLSPCPSWIPDCVAHSGYSSEVISVFALSTTLIMFLAFTLINIVVKYGKKRKLLNCFKLQLLYITVQQAFRLLWWPFEILEYSTGSVTQHELEVLNLICFLIDFALQIDFANKQFVSHSTRILFKGKKRLRVINALLVGYQGLVVLVCFVMMIVDLVNNGIQTYSSCLVFMSYVGLVNSMVIIVLVAIVFGRKCKNDMSVISHHDRQFAIAVSLIICSNLLRFVMENFIRQRDINPNLYGVFAVFLPNIVTSIAVITFCILVLRVTQHTQTASQIHARRQSISQGSTFQYEMQIVTGQRRRRRSSHASGIPRPRRTSNEIPKQDYTNDYSLSLSDDEATPAPV